MSKVNEQSVSPASVNLYYVFRPVHSQQQAGHEAKRQRGKELAKVCPRKV